MASSVREAGKEHIPRYPPGWITIRILQLIVAVVTLGLCAYLLVDWVGYAGFYVQIWACTCTIIVSIWLICAHSCSPRAYNYWAVLVLDIYLYILWLSGFAVTAVNAALIIGYKGKSSSSSIDDDLDDIFGDYWKPKMLKRYIWDYDYGYSGRNITRSGAIAAAAAGLGALEFVFFFICLVTNAIVIYRHRKVGLHSRPVKNHGASMVVMQQPRPSVGVPSAYQAVPQQGIPYQQDTAYNPHGPYNPQPVYQQPAGNTYPYPVAKSVSPAPPSSTPTPQPYSPQPQYPVTQPPTGGH